MTKVMPFGKLTDENGNEFSIYEWEVTTGLLGNDVKYTFVCTRIPDLKTKEIEHLKREADMLRARTEQLERDNRDLREKISGAKDALDGPEDTWV